MRRAKCGCHCRECLIASRLRLDHSACKYHCDYEEVKS